MASRATSAFPRYEVDETPSSRVASGLGIQSALIAITPIALFPMVLAQSVSAADEFSDWAVFAMLVVNGAGTIVQACQFGRTVPVCSLFPTLPRPQFPFASLPFSRGEPPPWQRC